MSNFKNKNSFNKVVLDIKNLEIQGATNIAIAAVKSLKFILSDFSKIESKSNSKSNSKPNKLISELKNAKKKLFKSRPTEPMLRNALNYVLSDVDKYAMDETDKLILRLNHRIDQALEIISKGKLEISKIGSKKIKKNMVVFTHCHSKSVVDILLLAKSKGKKFEVHNTETRPRYQGRKTAKELASHGIKVTHYVDSAARLALKKADLFLIGADAITVEGKVINKIGSELFAEVAKRYQIPIYVCTHSWKFDPQTIFGFEEPIELRSESEVWPDKPKNVKIQNFAFEQVDPDLISGVITELGIYKPESLVEELKSRNKFMF
ncbi:ribose 1,5-bisphosphate isomerase [Candidatus Woesearchaeota archaeon]|jgi:ribose 1,5-bisphosphate isomerase|nr:ribose 1,5-bisphosphate isomerase [Candidatus Woesearchaeota archaeon]MBT6520388.1 ribose 1,5-bisphosphate isomerase [Candidatus Woesearchaeota archaeon]MBT7368719.1 ribose 1,5-bisphosphate isomerase [Candidatus Woesearchaeota archaeon]